MKRKQGKGEKEGVRRKGVKTKGVEQKRKKQLPPIHEATPKLSTAGAGLACTGYSVQVPSNGAGTSF